MRKVFLAALPVLFLLSCSRESGLAPETVLERTVRESKALQSARFDGNISFDNFQGLPFFMDEGSVSFSGMMTNGGDQLSLSFDAANESSSSMFSGDIVVLGNQETYLLIKQLSFPGRESLSTDSRRMLDTWWKLPANSEKMRAEAISPDPRFLKMQATVVDVVKDRGISQEEGHDVIRYDVSINKEKLSAFLFDLSNEADKRTIEDIRRSLEPLSAEGELWIDANTFVLRNISWRLSLDGQESGRRIEADISFRDHNANMEILPPADAVLLSSSGIDIFSLSTSVFNGAFAKPATEIYTTE